MSVKQAEKPEVVHEPEIVDLTDQDVHKQAKTPEFSAPQAPERPAPENVGPVIYVRMRSGGEYTFAGHEARAMRGEIRRRHDPSHSQIFNEPILIETKAERRETCIMPEYIESFDWYPEGLK